MLVTNPSARATLAEVLAHPWMVRNFAGPPDAHLVQREPLRSDELERDVIRGMTGFEFGTEDDIEGRLVAILNSPKYRHAVDIFERKRELARGGKVLAPTESYTSFAALSGSTSVDSFTTSKEQPDSSSASVTKRSSKRFSGLDFYRKKLFSSSSSPPTSPITKVEAPPPEIKEIPDPTRGFHPLISIYYLVREKLERERVYGPGHFASSQLSLAEAEVPATVVTPAPATTLPSPPTPSLPSKPPVSASGKADYSMPLPRLPAPEKSHYSELSYESPQSSPNPAQTSFSAGAQPRAKTDALGTGVVPMRHPVSGDKENLDLPSGPAAAKSNTLAPPASAALPRAPPASTHRRSQSLNQRPSVLRAWGAGPAKGISSPLAEEDGTLVPPQTAGPEVQGFADRAERQRVRAESSSGAAARPLSAAFPSEKPLPPTIPQEAEEDAATVNGTNGVNGVNGVDELEPVHRHRTPEPPAPLSAGATLVRRFGTLMGRSESHGGHKAKRASILVRPHSPGGSVNEKAASAAPAQPEGATPPSTQPIDIPNVRIIDAPFDGTTPRPIKEKTGLTTSASHPVGGFHRRAATLADTTGTKQHHRRGSVGSVTRVLSVARGTSSRKAGGTLERPTTAGGDPQSAPAHSALKEGIQEEEQEAALAAAAEEDANALSDSGGANEPKPVYLKGLFSVATTSTKSASVIRTDVRRVLDRMQVQYREIKGGFECIHLPSIDLSSIGNHADLHVDGSPSTGPPRHRTVARKVSRLSFGGRRGPGGKEKELPERPPSSNGDASKNSTTNVGANAPNNGSSLFNSVTRSTNTVDTLGQIPDTSVAPSITSDGSPPQPSPIANKFLPSTPATPATVSAPPSAKTSPPVGQVDDGVFEHTAANNLCVRFEVNIVKVCFPAFYLRLGRYADHVFSIGPLAPSPWYTVQESRWRRMAVSNARSSRLDRTEAITTPIEDKTPDSHLISHHNQTTHIRCSCLVFFFWPDPYGPSLSCSCFRVSLSLSLCSFLFSPDLLGRS